MQLPIKNATRGLLTGLAFFWAAPATAQITLAQPIDCALGDTCFIQQYTDLDPGPNHTDFTCGALSYDGHKGTDFALPTLADLSPGVAVLAAASGTVMGARGDMLDHLQGTDDAPDVTDRECGNGVVLGHDDGWETQYCHLARGSITVTTGDQVEVGDILGFVGLSGNTEFPHLHLSVRHNGTVIDPFSPAPRATCGPSDVTLWQDPPAYIPGGLLRTGLTGASPTFDDVKSGAHLPPLASDAPIIGWAFYFGSRQGDTLTLTITGPQGTVHHTTYDQDQTAQGYKFTGRRTPPAGWPPGEYILETRLVRNGTTINSLRSTATIP